MKAYLKSQSNFFVKLCNIAFICFLVVSFSMWASEAQAKDALTEEQNEAIERALSRGSFPCDGTFEGQAEGFGGPICVSVTVDNGYLDTIEIVSAEKEDEAWLNEAVATIPAMLKQQTTNVDVVSGATYSSVGIINATKAALANAQEEA
jgi:uncharacterized protein with FMN-binding domain